MAEKTEKELPIGDQPADDSGRVPDGDNAAGLNSETQEPCLQNAQEAAASEARLRKVIEHNPDGMFIVDQTGTICFANPAACALWRRGLEEILGMPFGFPLVAGEMMEIDILRDGGTIVGEMRSVEMDWQGESAFLVSLRDITRRRQMEKEKADMEAHLRQTQKMEALGMITGGIAHEFNNFLQSISGYCQLLKTSTNLKSVDCRYLVAIDQSIQRAADVVKGLLTFSRGGDGGKQSLDIVEQLKESHKLLTSILPRMIHIEVDLPDNPAFIRADQGQIEQMIFNLAFNARDAMPHGGCLVFTAKNLVIGSNEQLPHPELHPGRYVLLEVSDSGCGMEESTLKHIFEPFFTTKEIGQGTGLGLAMVYGIVQDNQGLITCESAPGRGTTFRIYLPVIEQEPTTVIQEEDVENTHGRGTILLVDDELAIRETVSDFLKQSGFNVLTAENGEDALEIFGNWKHDTDLILLDLDMPGMGGCKCLRELRMMDPSAKVLITSGYPQEMREHKASLAGTIGYITKPYSLPVLVKEIVNIIGKK